MRCCSLRLGSVFSTLFTGHWLVVSLQSVTFVDAEYKDNGGGIRPGSCASVFPYCNMKGTLAVGRYC